MRRRFQQYGNLALIVVLSVAAAYLVMRRSVLSEPSSAIGYQPGDQIDVAKLGVQERVLILVTRSTCRFCSDSMNFYRSLTAVPILWVAAGEDVETNRRYLAQHGITAQRIVSSSDAGLTGLRVTPTLIAVGRGGRVVGAWTGRLGLREEEQVRTALGGS